MLQLPQKHCIGCGRNSGNNIASKGSANTFALKSTRVDMHKGKSRGEGRYPALAVTAKHIGHLLGLTTTVQLFDFVIIVASILSVISLVTIALPAYGQSQEDHGSSNDGSIDYATIGYWIGFFGLGAATALLLVRQLVSYYNDRFHLLKFVIAILAITTGIIHLLLTLEHMQESLLFGAFFAISGASLIAYGVIAGFLKRKIIYYIGMGGTVVLIGLFLFTRLAAVPFSEDASVEAISGLDIVTKVIEVVLLGVLIYAISLQGRKLEKTTSL